MVKLNTLLAERFKKKEKGSSKTDSLAEASGAGGLSSFGGVFRICPLNEHEHKQLFDILQTYKNEDCDFDRDLTDICALTSEVKAINNQAVILHGERIQKAQDIFKLYRDGAFTEWMIASYGNRQTPYNFLQYYKFYTTLSEMLKKKTDLMPRQVIYTLASREGDREVKESIINNFHGESKETLLSLIRQKFPLPQEDKRSSNPVKKTISSLKRTIKEVQGEFKPSPKQLDKLKGLADQLNALIKSIEGQ
ncbi:MAG: CT583 family protein [Chlamydiia bacterium]|nr:CT583 family protein [Chlamydiia bacterium]